MSCTFTSGGSSTGVAPFGVRTQTVRVTGSTSVTVTTASIARPRGCAPALKAIAAARAAAMSWLFMQATLHLRLARVFQIPARGIWHGAFFAFRYSFGSMQQAVKTASTEGRLTLAEVLDWMVEDGLATSEAAAALKTERRYHRGNLHPLCVVAEQKWKKGAAPLTLDYLSEWLAKHLGMEYLHIDPLKIDFAAVTEVMSSAYAGRFRILPVAVNAKEAVIATAEPNVRDWEPELARIIKRDIRRVIANPVDIERYQVEFYNLAKSIKGAKKNAAASTGLSNFEQLVELGKLDKQLDANDAHVVRVVDWLWQYAFEQRASDIHIEPRREH